jgi:hypothetical protein
MIDGKLDAAEVNAAFGGVLEEDTDPSMIQIAEEAEKPSQA